MTITLAFEEHARQTNRANLEPFNIIMDKTLQKLTKLRAEYTGRFEQRASISNMTFFS